MRAIRCIDAYPSFRLRSFDMNSWIRRILASLAIILIFVAFMFLYPALYNSLGRILAMSMWLVLIFMCEGLWNFVCDNSKRSE